MKIICLFFFICQTIICLVDAGPLSASVELLGLNGAVVANGVNPGLLNGALLGQQQIAQMVSGLQPFVLQQPGIGQVGLQQAQLLAVGQQQAGTPQLQGQLIQLPNGGFVFLLPQGNGAVAAGAAGAGQQLQILTPGQQAQILPVVGGNCIQQPAAAIELAAAAQPVGNGAVRVKHSAPGNPMSSLEAEETAPLTNERPTVSLAEALRIPLFSSKMDLEVEEGSDDDLAVTGSMDPAAAATATPLPLYSQTTDPPTNSKILQELP
ncbi:uncharacterized protein LOC136763985 [Amia ocellicauda]|uniref:uncharacterized protein LOC136763985 n=1 Tax=Amia ocellicauda TaxID=2972642 RepID=UPI003463B0A4